MKKRLLSVLLTVVMVLSLFPTAAFAVTVDNTYQPGTYTASAPGHDDALVTVKLTLEQQEDNVVISDLQADGSTQTPTFWAKVEEAGLLDRIKEANGTTGVDVVSSATHSSQAVLDAVDQALAQATSMFSGSGTSSDPYTIVNAAQLKAFATAVDGGNTYAGEYVALGANIDLSGIDSWNPIGGEAKDSTNIFQGTFNGQGYTIGGLTIDANVTSGEGNYGLFSTLGNQAVVKNLNIVGAQISVTGAEAADNIRAGVIAGCTGKAATSGHGNISTRIDSCSATGSVSASSANDKLTYAGGIAGMGNIGTTITNCWTDVSISAVTVTKNSMAGGIIGSSGRFVVVANCATFGNVYAASPSATNYGGMAGGIVGMMAGKQYNAYAASDITVGNGGITAHTWVGALDGQITVSDMPKDSDGTYTTYPAEGAFRLGNYYASDAALKVEVYKNDGAELDTTKTIDPTVDRGFSSTTPLDKAMVSVAMTKAAMVSADFADTLNGNISTINGILAAYGITGIALREWQSDGGRILPTGAVWTTAEISDSIFASGDGTADTPYLIATEEQLRNFATSLSPKIDYTGKYVALANDINVSSEAWTPIGGSDYLFNGTFDGRGYAINGMTLGTKDAPFALDKENIYIGLFGVLGPKSVVKNVNLTNVAFYTTYAATAYLGGIAGVTQGSTTSGDYTGALIDSCSVSGTLYLNNTEGNHFVGGLVGMQYKGATINSHVSINATGIVDGGDLAEVGGLAGLNNRGLIANCWTDNELLYASGNRENGNEGMAVVSNLVACNAGALVNCYASGDLTTREFSTYAGMVSGWVTGIGKSYNCWYDLDSTMINGAETDNPVTMNPVAPIGTKVASGVTEEGDIYTGGLVDKMTAYDAAGYAAIASGLNASFAAFPIDITAYGIDSTALKTWVYDAEEGLVTFGDQAANVTYVQPDCEKVEKPEQVMQDGVWYGRDDGKTTVVKITVKDNAVTETKVLSGKNSGEAYDAALAKAQYKAIYGDFSHYEPADPTRFDGGSGTESDPYRIATEAQLRYLAESINADVDWRGVYFQQTANIKLTGGDWLPIGWSLNGEVNGKKTSICAYPFRGNYDGGSHTITGMTLGSADAPVDCMTTGLFGLTSGSLKTNDLPTKNDQVVRLKNIHLRNIDVHVATRYETFAGGLVGSGQNGIYIDNCSVTGVIDSTTTESFCRVGGLAASVLRGAVTNCWTDVDVSGVTDTNNVYAGALYGMDNRVTTVNCYTLGDVTGYSTNPSKVYLGGLAGQGGGIHLNCYSAGNVISKQVTGDVGILNGRSAGISVQYNSYFNTGAVLKQGDTVISPAKAVGTITTNATETNIVGKTAAELKSEAFANLLNSNITASNLNAAIEEILKALTNQSGNGFTQQNYYEGNQLLSWTVRNNTVVFGSEAADAVTAVIDNLPSVSAVQYSNYQQYKSTVAAARAAYESLSAEQQKMVDPDKLAELEELEKAIDGFQAIDDVKDQLDKLPSAGDLTVKDQEAVKAAKDAYDKLTDDQKKYLSDDQVDKMEKLTDRMDEIIKSNPSSGGSGSGKKPGQSNGKDVKSGNTGDAGISLYVGMGLVAVIACGALFVKRKLKEN